MTDARPRGRLFGKYVAFLVVLVGGLLIASGLFELYFSYQEAKRALVRLEREKALAAAERIERFIKDIERQLRATTYATSDDPAVAPSGRKGTGFRESLASALIEQREIDFLRFLRSVPAAREVRHLDIGGKEQLRVSRFALDAIGSGKDFSESPAFVEAKKTGTTYFSPVYFYKDSEPYMTIAVPSGEYAVEVTVAEVSLKAIWDVVSRIRVGRLGHAYVVDGRGHLIAHPDVSLVLQKRDLSDLAQVREARAESKQSGADETQVMIAQGLDGVQVLAAHAPISLLQWLVFVEQPLAEAFAPLQASLLRGGIILILGLALAVLASVVLARRMVAPIRVLQAGAARIGAGELGHRIEVRTGDELEALGDEFNRTAARLQESYAGLEQKVAERTEELTRSLAETRALGDVVQAVNSSLDLEQVLVTIVTHAVQLSHAKEGTIYEYDEATGIFEPRANYGASQRMINTLHESQIRIGDMTVGQCAQRKEPVQLPDVESQTGYRLKDLLLREGIRSTLAVPLLQEDRVIGALVIRRSVAGEFPQATVGLLQTFAAQSVLAIQNARLFRELQDKSEALAAASQHKSQFLANMSHELRTPLNAIIGVTEMMQEDARDLKREDELEPLDRVIRAARHLLALINDILDLSKIEAGKMELHLEPFAVAPLVEDVVKTIQPLADKSGNELTVSCADDVGTIRADQTRVRQALLNLLSNANKFTERGKVTVAVHREAGDSGDWITMTVADTGIGMTVEQIGRLFQDFVQADTSTTRRYGGTGLGLAISKRFCQMMGGDIAVESEAGRGSTFTIRLPAEIVAAQPVPLTRAMPSGQAQAPAESPDVLVVDDDITVREMAQRYLTREGFSVITADGGREGLRLTRELRPSAVTLDVIMPDIDGWTVLAAIKGDPTLADIPVVLMSIVDEKNRGYSLGAADYLVKPVDRERLSAVLRGIVGLGGGSVLLVDDDDFLRRGLAQGLEKDGWTIAEAENGRAGLARLDSSLPDAIVLDLMMPEMDGFEFLEELRHHAEWRDIPVVVVTAKDLTDEDHRRLNGEVEGVLQKDAPTRDEMMKAVSATLSACIGRGRARKAARARS
ncbi:MAG TPA: response regulator [Burkholderiales bacterium]|nr:response regulator [Burkholderiales bacterium]